MAIQIVHLLRHPLPTQFVATLKSKPISAVLADLRRIDEFNENQAGEINLAEKLYSSIISDPFVPLDNQSKKMKKLNLTRQWSHLTGSCSDGDIVMFNYQSNQYIVSSAHDGTIISVNLETGKLRFKIKLSTSKPIHVSIVENGILVVLSTGQLVLLDINGEITALKNTNTTIHAPGLVAGNYLYQPVIEKNEPKLAKFELPQEQDSNFEQIFKVNLSQSVNSSPVLFDESIYTACLKGHIYCHNQKGQIMAKIELDGLFFQSPKIVENCLLLLDVRGRFFRLSKSLELLTKLELNSEPIYAPLLEVNNTLLAFDQIGQVFCIDGQLVTKITKLEKVVKKVHLCGDIFVVPFIRSIGFYQW